jgi:tricarballylate dehydrogenase
VTSLLGDLQSFDGIDVLVVGGGNAALCAALAAREEGASVLLLERDTPEWRGGNSKYTRNVRCAHDGGPGLAPYPEDELLDDLVRVTGESIDLGMAEFTIQESKSVPAWMERQGSRWQPALHGTLQLNRTNRFFLGGGKALLNAYYRTAAARGVHIRYEATVEGLEMQRGRLARAVVSTAEGRVVVRAGAVVAAAGGFESNLEWLRRYWGDAVDNYIIRGTRSNDGRLLAALLEMGAMERGNPKGFHAVAVDARSPRYEGGIVTRVDAIPFSITVNRDARRFYDEGDDVWPKRYATWGRLIAEQPGQIAYTIFDERVAGRFIPSLYPPVVAGGVAELAERLGLDPARLVATVEEYNRHLAADGRYDISRLDGCGTEGLEPAKSNWALPIDTPPFRAYTVRPGITFTYLGVAVDRQARVLSTDGLPFPGVYAAGEIMAGNVLLRGYLAGFGMTIGTVYGRIAGKEAANFARTA